MQSKAIFRPHIESEVFFVINQQLLHKTEFLQRQIAKQRRAWDSSIGLAAKWNRSSQLNLQKGLWQCWQPLYPPPPTQTRSVYQASLDVMERKKMTQALLRHDAIPRDGV